MPKKKNTALTKAVNKLDLPEEVRQQLIGLVVDPPPPDTCPRVVDALKRVLKAGYEDESELAKHYRVCIYALVFYPGQYVQDHHYLSFQNGSDVRKDSEYVKTWRRNSKKKIEKYVQDQKMEGVAYIRSKITSDPTTTSGFRLTVSGDDYVERVNQVDEKKANRQLRRFQDNLSDDRIRPENVSSPLLREYVVERKELVKSLNSSEVRALLQEPTKRKGPKAVSKQAGVNG